MNNFLEERLLRYILSKEEKKKILCACHTDPTAGHMGKNRTLYKIKEKYMWHALVKDVVEQVIFVQNSAVCINLYLYTDFKL